VSSSGRATIPAADPFTATVVAWLTTSGDFSDPFQDLQVQMLNQDDTTATARVTLALRRPATEPWGTYSSLFTFTRQTPSAAWHLFTHPPFVAVATQTVTAGAEATEAATGHRSRDLASLALAKPDEGWAGGTGGTLWHHAAGRWQPAEPLGAATITSIALTAPDNGWAISSLPGPNVSTFLHLQRDSWTPVLTVTSVLNSLAFAGTDTGWAVGQAGALYQYRAGTWAAAAAGTANNLRAVALRGPEESWAVGEHSTILHYQAGVWQAVPSPVQISLYGVALDAMGSGWAMGTWPGTGGIILHLVDGIWQRVDSPPTAGLASVSLIGDTGWIAGTAKDGHHGVILRLTAGHWQVETMDVPHPLYAIATIAPGSAWAVGLTGTFMQYVDGTWMPANP